MSSRLNHTVLMLLISMVVLSSISRSVAAQRQRSRRPQLEKKTSSGEAVKVAGGMLQIREKSGDFWLLKAAPRSKVTFIGKADASWLRPGMIARIETEFDKKGKAQSAVKTVQVFTPRPEYQVGAFGGDPKQRRSNIPQQLLVAGVIKKIQDNQITILAGTKSKKTYTAELDPKVEVEVDLLGDLNWVQPGDEINFKGKYYVKGQALCESIDVKSKAVLKGRPAKSRKRRSKRKSSALANTASEKPGEDDPQEREAAQETDESTKDSDGESKKDGDGP